MSKPKPATLEEIVGIFPVVHISDKDGYPLCGKRPGRASVKPTLYPLVPHGKKCNLCLSAYDAQLSTEAPGL